MNLSINYEIKFSEDIKQEFKKTISWNKDNSEITTQPKNNNLSYVIDPIFRSINRFFVISFKNGINDATRDSFEKYYMSLAEIKYFNVLIDNKTFFEQPVKNKQKTYEKLIEMSRNDDYTTVNLLDYLYHQSSYKLISIDLSRKTNTNICQQINFIGKLQDNGAFCCCHKNIKK